MDDWIRDSLSIIIVGIIMIGWFVYSVFSLSAHPELLENDLIAVVYIFGLFAGIWGVKLIWAGINDYRRGGPKIWVCPGCGRESLLYNEPYHGSIICPYCGYEMKFW